MQLLPNQSILLWSGRWGYKPNEKRVENHMLVLRVSSGFQTLENNKTTRLADPQGCFRKTLNVPRGDVEGNIEVEGKQPEGPVIKNFFILPDSKMEKKKLRKKDLLHAPCISWLHSQNWAPAKTNLSC